MNISEIEQQAFKLSDLWQKSLDERTEQGLVIMSMELEASMEALSRLVKHKQEKLKRAAIKGRKRGGQWKELPYAAAQLRERLEKYHQGKISRLARELKCDRKTVAKRLKGE